MKISKKDVLFITFSLVHNGLFSYFKCMDFSAHLMILTVGKHIFSQKNLRRLYTTSANLKMSTGERVGLPLKKVTTVLENFASKQLSESWDNTGLLVEPYTAR